MSLFRKDYTFYVYLITNPTKTMLYIGVTNNLSARLNQHFNNRGIEKTYAGKFYCYNLVYYEIYQYINEAIAREKQIKKWSRIKKEKLINSFNPDWETLNARFHIKE